MGEPLRDDGSARPSTDGPPAWIILLVTAVVAALVVGGIIGFRAWRGDGDEPEAAAPVVAAPSTTAEPDVPERRLFTRETDTGIEVRVDLGVPAGVVGDLGMGEGAPAFCQVVDQATATAISNDEVLQGWLPLTEAAPPDPAPTMLGTMMGFGATGMLGLVVQLDDDAVNARLSTPGRIDEMEPVEGIAALVVTMPAQPDAPGADNSVVDDFPGRFGLPQLDDVTLSVNYADGRVRHVRGDDLTMGPMIWRGDPECFGGPPEVGPPETFSEEDNPFNVRLPPPGEQPTDPAAGRAAIEAAMSTLYGAGDDVDVLILVDDPFAIRETFDRIGDLDIGADWADVEVVVEELVFLSPVEAAFEYTVRVEAFFTRDEQFGRARLVDGTWRVGRGTICRDLQESFATTCPP